MTFDHAINFVNRDVNGVRIVLLQIKNIAAFAHRDDYDGFLVLFHHEVWVALATLLTASAGRGGKAKSMQMVRVQGNARTTVCVYLAFGAVGRRLGPTSKGRLADKKSPSG